MEQAIVAPETIYWDGYGLENPSSGVHVHAVSLARELAHLGVTPMVLTKAACPPLPAPLRQRPLKGAPGVSRILESKPLWPQRVGDTVARAMRGHRSSYVIHGLSNFNVPLFSRNRRLRRVLTVHDLIPLLAGQLVSKSLVLQLRALFGPACQAADRIVCVSEWTRRTLLELYPRLDGKTVVIRNGRIAEVPTDLRSPQELRSILSIARFERYKRLDLLVQIARRLPGTATLTLLTCARGVEYCRHAAADLVSQGRLVVLRDIDEEAKFALYDAADVFLHTSQFEGFCLPIAEALARGCPVVFQSGSAIDEIVTPEVGVGLASGAPLTHWIDAITSAMALRLHQEWPARLKAHLESMPTWKEAAVEFKTLYNDLM